MATSRLLRSARALALVTILAFLQISLSQTTARGGIITLESQQRSVDVNTTGLGNLPPQDQRQTASGFAPFNGMVSINLSTAAETAMQSSTLSVTPDGSGASFIADSSIFHQSVSLSGLPSSSVFQVSFDVSAPVPYHLSYDGFTVIGNGRYGETALAGSFTGPTAPGTLMTQAPFPNPIQLTGTLQPGAYTLQVTGPGDGANFDVDLEIAAVPVPPACWIALSTLPLVVLGKQVLARKLVWRK